MCRLRSYVPWRVSARISGGGWRPVRNFSAIGPVWFSQVQNHVHFWILTESSSPWFWEPEKAQVFCQQIYRRSSITFLDLTGAGENEFLWHLWKPCFFRKFLCARSQKVFEPQDGLVEWFDHCIQVCFDMTMSQCSWFGRCRMFQVILLETCFSLVFYLSGIFRGTLGVRCATQRPRAIAFWVRWLVDRCDQVTRNNLNISDLLDCYSNRLVLFFFF